jgi:hypothetical protein
MIHPINPLTLSKMRHSEESMNSLSPPKEICSIQSLNPTNGICSLLTGLFRILKNIFCCLCCQRSQPLGKGENIPEIDPRKLSRNDPFRNEVFTFDSKGNFSFLSQEAFEKTSALFRFLGTHSYWSWISHVFSLTAQESKVKELHPLPLAFLYYIFCNRTHTANVIHFQEQAIKGKWILKYNTGRDPWEEFLNQQEEHFNETGNILQQVPGFCKSLGIEEKPIQKLAKAKKWRDLIIFVFEERKKHFKL